MNKIIKGFLLEWAILLFAFFPIIPNRFKWTPVAILLLVSLLHYKKDNYNYKWFFINSSLYLFYILSLIYTNNFAFAFKKLETSFSILILPLVFFIILPKKVFKENLVLKFMKLFILSSLIFSVIIIIHILFDATIEYYKDFYSNKYRILVESTPLIGQHPIYSSIFLGIALIFSIYLFYGYKPILKYKFKIFVLANIIINTILIIMLSSKGVLISLIIILLIGIFKSLIISKNKIKVITLLCIFISIISFLFLFNRRMNEMIKIETYSQVDSNYSNSYRIGIYKCVIDVIKENWLFGYGLGDAQDILNKCYESKSELLLEKTYNSHNQFFDTWIKTGIFGLLLFLTFLYLNFRSSIKSNDYVFMSILLFFILNFMVENILARQSGVILFSFFVNFFGVISKP